MHLEESSKLFNGAAKRLVLEIADIYLQINTKLSKLFSELSDDCKVKTDEPRNLWTKELREQQAILLGDIAMLERRTDKLSEKLINGQ